MLANCPHSMQRCLSCFQATATDQGGDGRLRQAACFPVSDAACAHQSTQMQHISAELSTNLSSNAVACNTARCQQIASSPAAVVEIACLRYCDCSDYRSSSNPYRYTLIDSGLPVSRVQGYPTNAQPFDSRQLHTGSHLPGTCPARQTDAQCASYAAAAPHTWCAADLPSCGPLPCPLPCSQMLLTAPSVRCALCSTTLARPPTPPPATRRWRRACSSCTCPCVSVGTSVENV